MMTMLLTVLLGLVLSASSAVAMTQEECLQSTSGGYQGYCQQMPSQQHETRPGPTWEQQQQFQRDMARQQAMGFAAFGSGAALISGMNQGLARIQVQPYVVPPPAHYSTR